MNNFSLLGKINVFLVCDHVELGLSSVQNDRNEKQGKSTLLLWTAIDI